MTSLVGNKSDELSAFKLNNDFDLKIKVLGLEKKLEAMMDKVSVVQNFSKAPK